MTLSMGDLVFHRGNWSRMWCVVGLSAGRHGLEVKCASTAWGDRRVELRFRPLDLWRHHEARVGWEPPKMATA